MIRDNICFLLKRNLTSFRHYTYLGMLTIVMKTKTFTVSANQRVLLVSRNAKTNPINDSENKSVRHLIRATFL